MSRARTSRRHRPQIKKGSKRYITEAETKWGGKVLVDGRGCNVRARNREPMSAPPSSNLSDGTWRCHTKRIISDQGSALCAAALRSTTSTKAAGWRFRRTTVIRQQRPLRLTQNGAPCPLMSSTGATERGNGRRLIKVRSTTSQTRTLLLRGLGRLRDSTFLVGKSKKQKIKNEPFSGPFLCNNFYPTPNLTC